MEQSAEATEGQVPVGMYDEAEHGDTLAVFGTEEGAEGGEGARHFHYQPWLSVAAGGPLWALAEEVFASIPAPSVTPGRSLRKDATERRRLAVFSLLANLTVLALSPLHYEGLVLGLARDVTDRYSRAAFSVKVLHQATLSLELLGIVSVEHGVAHKTRTRLSVSDGFKHRLSELGVSLSEIVTSSAHPGETIQLKRRRPDGKSSELCQYSDDSRTCAFRHRMEELNASLSGADIRLDGQPIEPFRMVRIFLDDPTAPPWTRHGRLYRGPVLNLKKEERYRVTIAGEAICDLDWRSSFISICYGITGAAIPESDPYAIPGLESAGRDTVKQIMSALLSRKPPKVGRKLAPFRLPVGVGPYLPDGWNGKRFLEAARAYHAPIAHLFDTADVWALASYLESEMMLDVLEELRATGIICIPFHDGVLCRVSHKARVAAAMEAVSLRHIGQTIRVSEKVILRPQRPSAR